MLSRSALISRLRELGVVKQQSVKLKSGICADFYCDMKETYGYPDLLPALIYQLSKKTARFNPFDVMATAGYGGIPLGIALMLNKYKYLSLLRTEECKGHGMQKMIEGFVPKTNNEVVLIDDVLTSGDSLKEMAGIITSETGAKIAGAAVLVDRSKKHDCAFPVESVFNIEELL